MAGVFRRERPDQELVRRVLAGNRDEFAVLVRRHLSAVQAVAYAHVRNAPDVDDIAQEAFAKALERLDSLRDWSKFRSWLLSIVRRVCLDWHQSRNRETALDAAHAEGVAVAAVDAGREELRQALLQRIYALVPHAREVLLLHYYADFSTREIAEELEISQEAVKKRLQRAREVLSRDLSDDLRELLRPAETADARTRRIAQAMAGVALPWLKPGEEASRGAFTLASLAQAKVVWLAASVLVVLTVAGWQAMRETEPPAAITSPSPGNNGSAADAVAPGVSGRTNTPDSPDPEAEAAAPIVVAQDEETAATEPSTVAAALRPLGSVMALVYDSDAKPVEGVELTAERVDWEPYESPPDTTLVRRAISDPHGRYFFDDLPLGAYVVQARADGRYAIAMATLGEGTFTKDARLYLRPSAPVTGRVVNARGEPVEGAYVYTYFSETDSKEQYYPYRTGGRVRTDSDGRFNVSHLWLGKWRFYVIAGGYATYLSDWIQAGTENVEFVLNAGQTAAVSVVDEQGEALEGAHVLLSAKDAYRDRHVVATAADGTAFFTKLRPAEYRVAFDDAEWAAGEAATLDLASGDSTATLVARPAASVSGKVALDDGTPVPDVVVRAEPPEASGLNPVSATTGLDGRYSIAGLGAAEYTVTPRHFGGLVPNSESKPTLTTKPGDELGDVDFTFAETLAVIGRVIDGDGQAVSNAEVQFSAGYGQSFVRAAALTGTSGGFAFRGLMEGAQCYVWAKTDTQLSAPVGPFTLSAGDNDPVAVQIYEAASVSGVVVDADGNPAPGVQVSASPKAYIELRSGLVAYASLGTIDSRSAADGSFEVAGLHAGGYNIQVSGPGDNGFHFSNIRNLILEGGEHRSGLVVEWEGSPGGHLPISGRVTDNHGQPVSRAAVTAYALKGYTRYGGGTRSDEEGRFEIADLAPGTYDVNVDHERYSPSYMRDVPAGASGLTFALPERGDLVLRVLDATTGEPVTRFEYGLGDSLSTVRALDGLHEVQAANGETQLRNLVRGGKFVMFRATGYAMQRVRAEVVPRDEGESLVTVRLEPSARIQARVVDGNGEPISSSYVLWKTFGNNPRIRSLYEVGTTDADGRVLIDYLEAKPYTLFVGHADFAPIKVDVTPEPGVTREYTWTLTPGGTVSGTVLHAGQPAIESWISVQLTEEQYRFYLGSTTDTDGTFTIAHVPAGTYALQTQWRPEDNMSFRWENYPVTIAEGRETQVHIDMLAGTSVLEGHYHVNGGNDMTNMYLRAVYTDGSGGVQFGPYPDGSFHIENLRAGHARVEARFTDPETREQQIRYFDVDIEEGKTNPLEIDLDY